MTQRQKYLNIHQQYIYIYIYIYIPGKIILGEWKSTFKYVFNSNRVTTVDYQVATLIYDIVLNSKKICNFHTLNQ